MTNPSSSSPVNITPVILAGGSGTRLWPLSRKPFPKQFAPLLEGTTLFGESARRLSGSDAHLTFYKPLVLTNADFRFLVTEQLAEVDIEPGAILIEPVARNTAPAILAAALYIQAQDPNAFMLVAPSDHVIPDAAAFHTAVAKAFTACEQGDFVTFGVHPSRPETGYGYLELAESLEETGKAVKLKNFVEKPDRASAEDMIAAGNYLWNAGIFLFPVERLVAAFELQMPELLTIVRQAVDYAHKDLGFVRLSESHWPQAQDISIDYAIMERVDNLSVVPLNSEWSDLGDWNAVWNYMQPDKNGLASSGAVTAINCRDTLLRSESSGMEIVGIGLSNIVAIAMNDAVLVANRSCVQDVKLAMNALKEKGAVQAESFPKDYRPWGWYESLAVGPRFQVKRITVLPGGCLSLQSHFKRSEHWTIVEGTARVTLNGEVKTLYEDQSIYIPVEAIHRIENPGDQPMIFIEVQTGDYFGEDDIVRYEDKYARN